MNNKKHRHYLFVSVICLVAHSIFIQSLWADDLNEWQKGIIEGAFMFNSHLRSKNVQVDVKDNCATLRGYVDSELARALAEQFALSVKGINDVVNRLVVAPEKWTEEGYLPTLDNGNLNRLSNVTITNKVRSQLLANRITSGMAIDVETQNRTVTLSGVVSTEAEKTLTYWIVKNTQGVKNVVDKLDVMPATAHQAVVQLAE